MKMMRIMIVTKHGEIIPRKRHSSSIKASILMQRYNYLPKVPNNEENNCFAILFILIFLLPYHSQTL